MDRMGTWTNATMAAGVASTQVGSKNGLTQRAVPARTGAARAEAQGAGPLNTGTGAEGTFEPGAVSSWKHLSREIEDLRCALAAVVRSRADLQRDDVLELSRRLDTLIVKAQHALAAEPPIRR